MAISLSSFLPHEKEELRRFWCFSQCRVARWWCGGRERDGECPHLFLFPSRVRVDDLAGVASIPPQSASCVSFLVISSYPWCSDIDEDEEEEEEKKFFASRAGRSGDCVARKLRAKVFLFCSSLLNQEEKRVRANERKEKLQKGETKD